MPDEREYQTVVEDAEQAARAGDFALADERLREALRLQELAVGADHPELASTLNNLAVVCETLGRLDDAERFYRRAYAIASGALPPSDPLVITSRENLRDFCAARGGHAEDWPGIGELETPSPSPPPPPLVPPPQVSAARSPRAEPPASPWPTRALVAVATLAVIGTLAAVTSWRGPTTAPRPPHAAPVPATPAPAFVEAPGGSVPGATSAPADASMPARAPAAPAATPVEAPPVAPPAAAAPPPAARPDDVRLVVADVCASLTTSGAWRCEPLEDAAEPGRAAFYTRIASPRPLRVEHRWYQGAALRQRVTLSVSANPSAGYRTFSRQTLTAGAWRVELRAADGTLLHEAAFDVR